MASAVPDTSLRANDDWMIMTKNYKKKNKLENLHANILAPNHSCTPECDAPVIKMRSSEEEHLACRHWKCLGLYQQTLKESSTTAQKRTHINNEAAHSDTSTTVNKHHSIFRQNKVRNGALSVELIMWDMKQTFLLLMIIMISKASRMASSAPARVKSTKNIYLL